MTRTGKLGTIVIGLALGASLFANESAAGGPSPIQRADPALRLQLLRYAQKPSTRVHAFIQTGDPARVREEVERAGGAVGTVAGDIMTVYAPADIITRLSARPYVARLEGARSVRPKMEKGLVAIKADQVHAGKGLPTPFKGAGVVVGVIDYGLDTTHAAFKKSDGKTRVIGLWDQTVTNGTPPSGFTYGAACTSAQIDEGTCAHDSNADHGTHVTGIAAGGPVTGTPYVGVAPEADIAFVHLGQAPNKPEDEALTTAICDAASYIFKVAGTKPAVINMSLGEHSGPHDGSSLADRCLDNLTGPGKIIVAAAGNEGAGATNPFHNEKVSVHASGTASGQEQVLKLVLGQPGGAVGDDVVVWTNADVDLTIKVGVQSGNDQTFASTPVTLTQSLSSENIGAYGPVAGAGGAIPSGARGYLLRFSDGNSDKAEGNQVWLLSIAGNGRFDAFLDTTNGGGFLRTGQPNGVTVDNGMTIGFPGIASKVLAVASFVTRNAWTASNGSQQQQKDGDDVQVVLGALSGFSSRGPMRVAQAGVVKPDIAAPGEIIASALNAKHTPAPERLLKASPDGYFLAEGTSMATPHVAGVVALMLQRNPQLTVDQIRSIFDKTAMKPEGVTLPNADWGRGKVDALAAVTEALPAGVDAGVTDAPDAGAPNNNAPAGGVPPSSSSCSCHAVGGSPLPTGLAVAAGVAIALLSLRRRRR